MLTFLPAINLSMWRCWGPGGLKHKLGTPEPTRSAEYTYVRGVGNFNETNVLRRSAKVHAILSSFLHALWCVKVSISFIIRLGFPEAVNVDVLGSDQTKYVANP